MNKMCLVAIWAGEIKIRVDRVECALLENGKVVVGGRVRKMLKRTGRANWEWVPVRKSNARHHYRRKEGEHDRPCYKG